MLHVGDEVEITHPTGGCLPGAVYRVIETPEGRDPRWVWIEYVRGPLSSLNPERYRKPMGFDEGSLELAEPPKRGIASG